MRVWSSWTRMKTPKYNLQGRKGHQFLTVVVIGKNNLEQITNCLQSIAQSNYPKDRFEILCVVDHLEDKIKAIAESLNIEQLEIISLSHDTDQTDKSSFKERAMQFALTHALGDIIVCTHADCVVPIQWLAYIDYSMQQALVRLLVMPICLEEPQSILSRFQSLIQLAMTAFSGYGIKNALYYTANHANLAFRKTLYEELSAIDQFASDGVNAFIQAVAAQYPEGVKFLKSRQVVVQTPSEKTWASFLTQRKRWATKSAGYIGKGLFKLQVYTFLFHVIICINVILGLTIDSMFLFIGLFQFLLKGIMDYLLLTNMADFFQQRKSLKFYLISFILFVPYLFVVVFFGSYGPKSSMEGQ